VLKRCIYFSYNCKSKKKGKSSWQSVGVGAGNFKQLCRNSMVHVLTSEQQSRNSRKVAKTCQTLP